MSRYEHRTISTRTLDGLRAAEQLKREGWKVGAKGFETVQFYRPKQ